MVLALAGSASAAATYDSTYPTDQVFSTAVRFLRVDRDYKVTEKDAESGYLLFEYVSNESGKRTTPGSIEVVHNGPATRLVITLPGMPQYHEQALLEALMKKLVRDHGNPPPRPEPPAPKPAPPAPKPEPPAPDRPPGDMGY